MEDFYFLILYILPIVGIVQTIGCIVRGLTIEDWNSEYGIGLKRYYSIYGIYWLFAILVYRILTLELIDKDYTLLLFSIYFLAIPIFIAIYYCYVIFFMNKSELPLTKSSIK